MLTTQQNIPRIILMQISAAIIVQSIFYYISTNIAHNCTNNVSLSMFSGSKFINKHSRINYEAMLKVKNELHSSDIYTTLDTNPNTDPNYNYNIIIDEINQTKNKYMTSKLVKFNKYKHKKSNLPNMPYYWSI